MCNLDAKERSSLYQLIIWIDTSGKMKSNLRKLHFLQIKQNTILSHSADVYGK